MPPSNLSLLLRERLEIAAELKRRRDTNKIRQLYPDEGPFRRALYPKHIAFFAAGKEHNERAAIAANRVGKSMGLGGYETTLHLTGDYPDWWAGRRFDHPIDAWAASVTGEVTRDVAQLILTGVGGEGGKGELGTGLIPKAAIVGQPTHRRGLAGAIDTIVVKHASGGLSKLGFKSYDQGRAKFQGTEKHVIWPDEEPPEDVYDECLVRLMTTNGLMICTFTPLLGLSQVALKFLPDLAPAEPLE